MVIFMYDMHYDLLTVLYVLNNNKEYMEELKNNMNNLVGLNANLYFMSKDEMKGELGIVGDIDVVEMFKDSISRLKALDIDSKILYSIEGCDYINDILQLQELNALGLKCILLVWNNENKYGSGIRSDKGLTLDGVKFINKAIDLNMGIDLSHANERTFYGMIDVIKESGKDVVCYASHSNIYELQNNSRNLKIKQLEALRDVGGYLGLVMHPPFITDNADDEVIKKEFLKHVKLAVKIMGIDRVCLSSDNLEFYKYLDFDYVKSPFKQKNIGKDIESLLLDEFDEVDVHKIMYENALKIYEKLK